nr:homeobox protein knotted-1-like 2 [Ipomoea trifida]GLL22581.1 homeobox protein knotted-1-like 2 [Ipomoea trifida]
MAMLPTSKASSSLAVTWTGKKLSKKILLKSCQLTPSGWAALSTSHQCSAFPCNNGMATATLTSLGYCIASNNFSNSLIHLSAAVGSGPPLKVGGFTRLNLSKYDDWVVTSCCPCCCRIRLATTVLIPMISACVANGGVFGKLVGGAVGVAPGGAVAPRFTPTAGVLLDGPASTAMFRTGDTLVDGLPRRVRPRVGTPPLIIVKHTPFIHNKEIMITLAEHHVYETTSKTCSKPKLIHARLKPNLARIQT